MEECVLCKIAEGIIPSFKIYDDEDVVCVLNIFPASPGHILIFPRNHVEKLEDLEEEVLIKMMVLAKRLITILKEILKPDGYLVMVNTLRVYERTKHLYLELVPRYKDDGIKIFMPRGKVDSSELDKLKNAILSFLVVKDKKDEKKPIEEKKNDEYNIEEMLKWLRKEI